MFQSFVIAVTSASASLMVAAAVWCLKEVFRNDEIDQDEIGMGKELALSGARDLTVD